MAVMAGASFWREKFVAKGGPDGGDGGDGGDVYIQADENFKHNWSITVSNVFTTERGENGRGGNCTGKRGKRYDHESTRRYSCCRYPH